MKGKTTTAVEEGMEEADACLKLFVPKCKRPGGTFRPMEASRQRGFR